LVFAVSVGIAKVNRKTHKKNCGKYFNISEKPLLLRLPQKMQKAASVIFRLTENLNIFNYYFSYGKR
jgi:5'(3')-deoxyribonucleotidase